jgi:formamidopyrimidine-DNA glycosylase
MPELPEVEIMARNLHRWMADRLIERVEVLDEKLDEESLTSIEGARVIRVHRRAKYAVIDLSGEQHLVLHYRMTGKTVLDPASDRRARLRWVMDSGPPVVFEDPRRFGTCEWMSTQDLEPFFVSKKVGPEPWPMLRDGEWWKAQLYGLRGPIKPALMRQDRVAGLGNIAASESLFRAGVHPSATVPSLRTEQWDRIAEAVRAFIEHTLAEEGGDEIQYVNMGGEGSFSVYGHAGEPCPRCSGSIERMVQASRGTYFCPGCQSC